MNTQLHPVLQKQADMLAEAIPSAELRWNGTGVVLIRNEYGLSWAGERQTLPSGSTPLAVYQGVIGGQGWTEDEVRAFQNAVGAPVVYEFEVRQGN
jgi:hypothetical protein